MNRTQLELDPGVVLDARRALWLASERALVVADLHLGYAWAHRHAGQLLPLAPDDTLARLETLVTEFAPAQLVLLGDVLHGLAPVEAALDEVRALVIGIGSRTRLRIVEGNHDFALPGALRQIGSAVKIEEQIALGSHLLLHGHAPNALRSAALLAAAVERGGRIVFGHDHPAVQLSDGVATSARCPCFVAGEGALVLPCFTNWSTGSNIERGWLSPLGAALQRECRIAIVAGRLLPLAHGHAIGVGTSSKSSDSE
jgi:putative SbcD/Mre11-related phosphoesterase